MEGTDPCETGGGRGDASSYAGRLSFGRGSRLPMVRQTEVAECGLACLAMVSGYHGYHVGLSELRRRFPVSLKGMRMSRIIDIGQSLGLTSRPVRLELDELSKLSTPCILHWDMDHFVVLRRVGRRGCEIHDPAAGVRRLSWQEMSKHFTGVALEMSPGPQFERKRVSAPMPLRMLSSTVRGLSKPLVQVCILAIVLELLALLTPQFTQVVVDQVVADGDHDLLVVVGVGFVVVLSLQAAITALRSWIVMWVSTHFTLAWTGNVFSHLLRLPHIYFLKRHLGDIVSRFGSISIIQDTITTQLVTAIIDGIMATLTFIMLLVYSPLLTAVIGLSVAIYVALRLTYYRVLREANLSQIVVNAKQQSVFMEAVRGVQTLRLFNQGGQQTARYLNAAADSINTSIAVQRLNLIFSTASTLTSGAQRVAVLCIGGWLALRADMTAGMLMAFIAYGDQFVTRSGSLVDYIIQLRLLRLQGERLADIVLTPPEHFEDGIFIGPLPEPSISFRNVSFRYADGEPWVIRNASFDIRPGESVAITGPSGCGKSTLARLVLGLLDPQEGAILVGGIDLRRLGKKNFRDMLSSVMQDDTLFAGTIADNICFFDETARFDDIQEAARLAGLHDEIVAMPMGYHTLVGDMGSSLSGGQQQRVCIARALFRKPSILVLDEASSHLDVARETQINQIMADMQMTRIVIAHRPETIASADRLLLMLGGAPVEATVSPTSTGSAGSGESAGP